MRASGTMRGIALFLVIAVVAAACGSARDGTGPTVLVETGPADAGTEPHQQAIDELVREDALLAAKILNDAISGDDATTAAWASVYAKRLGLDHDEKVSFAALKKGAQAKDALLATLCWRWIAIHPGKPPAWKKGSPTDPVSRIFAAAAYFKNGAIPKPLKRALALQVEPLDENDIDPKDRLDRLRRLAMPFDDGPLAMAITFMEARRDNWTEGAPGGTISSVAVRLRELLIAAIAKKGLDPSTIDEGVEGPLDGEPTWLPDILESALLSHPPALLRNIIVTGGGKLRIEALRALAVTAVFPEAGDFGAASAALRSGDAATRVEAARTYLLLTARATRISTTP